MSRLQLLLLGLLLVAAPFSKDAFVRADEYDEDDDEDSGPKGDDDPDVAVLGVKNWDSIIKKSKFALVE
jgi:hypothetical protein